jgi:hypothetical protein
MQMRKRRNWKIILLTFALAITVIGGTCIAGAQEVEPARALTSFTDPSTRKVIIIGFVGGFVSPDDTKHPEVQFAAYLRDRYPFVHAEVFGNHHGKKALNWLSHLLDTEHNDSITTAEREQATIILYGHSWGAFEIVSFAQQLKKMNIPVTLTIQVDTINKPGRKVSAIPDNVASAINFYQTHGPLHGVPAIVAANPAQTRIIGNIPMTYDDRPINCNNYSWYSRLFNKPHHEIENDLRVWDEAGMLINSSLSNKTLIVETQSPSNSRFFKYLRRGVQADIASTAPPFEISSAPETK